MKCNVKVIGLEKTGSSMAGKKIYFARLTVNGKSCSGELRED